MINYTSDNFEQIYKIFQNISGSHSGIINNKIYQISSSNEDVAYCAMTADFPQYGRILGYKNDTTYHLSGYGCNREEALIRLIGECIERYSVVYAYEFLKSMIIYSSYDKLKKSKKNVMNLNYLNVYESTNNPYVKYIESNQIIGWIKLHDVLNGGYIHIPAQMFFLSYFNDKKIFCEHRMYFSVSTGTATHTSYKRSLENALIEYLQIDSFMLSWYSKNAKMAEVILDEKFNKFLEEKKLVSSKHELLVLDMTLDKPIPVFGVFIIGKDYPYLSFGIQAGKDPYHTLYRAILEASTILQYNYSSYIYDKDKYELGHKKENKFLDLDSNVVFWASDIKLKDRLAFLRSKIDNKIHLSDIETSDLEPLDLCLNYCKKNNYDIGCLDITCSELAMNEWNTVRCIIPQLLPMCLPGIPFENHPRMKEFGGCEYEYPHPLP